ncbi:MAG: adenylyl-sulfate kinase [Rhodospirillales bacterium]|nr:adenylyl-sulfate kinase [Rhodospirillales bacterium]
MGTITKLHADRQPLKITFVGHVDHGKSTLVGRLLHELNALPEGKVEAIQAQCKKRGMPFEWAFLMDALQAERDQGITIDTARIWFSTDQRDYVIIDAPGHKEFLKNMVTGAAGSDAAILTIDAHEGVQEQTRRHGYLLHLLGVKQVVAVVNKMDLVDYSEERFNEVSAELEDYLGKLGVTPDFIIPASGREGDNIAKWSENLSWYDGPTVAQSLDMFADGATAEDLPLRFPIQDVYKFDQRRIIAGRIESGTLKVGDVLNFSPTGKSARVSSIEAWPENAVVSTACPGQSVGITLDEQIFVERGQMAAPVDQTPIETNLVKARVFWMGSNPLKIGNRYKLKLNTTEVSAEVVKIEKVIDATNLSTTEGDEVTQNSAAEVVLRARSVIAFDDYAEHPDTGRFVLVEDYTIVGGGIVVANKSQVEIKSKNITAVEHKVSAESRTAMNSHTGGVLWLTGLSGSGKSTLAIELEKQLHLRGFQTYVLDGDNVRSGLNKDLGFSPEDRNENIRRIGEVANLFADAGFIVISAFISPYQEDRDGVRAIKPDLFHEVYIEADVPTCEARDPKGLYKKARAGKIPEFTGISAPYEAPVNPELVVPTSKQTVGESLEFLTRYVDETFVADGKSKKTA